MVVDGAGVDELAGRIDDIHVGGGFGFVLVTHGAGGVEKGGCGRGVDLRDVGILFGAGHEALSARSRREDGEPDDSFGGPLLLEVLHVAAGVVLTGVGAAVVGPFEDYEFTAVLGELVGLAVGVGGGEVRGGVADFGGVCGEGEGGE